MIERVLLKDGVVDLRQRRVWRSASTARLTGSEVEVLAALARVAGQAVDRQELLVRALGHEPDSLSRAVDLCVYRLRHKLESDPSDPVHLMTVQGVGYRLVPAETLEAVRTNVPPPRNRLLGREALLEQIQGGLPEGPVVLVGPAGVGKTRLAEELARAAAARSTPAGAWWVDLAEARDAAEVASAIARVVGVDARAEEPSALLAAVGRALRGRGPTLLVLDTCERAAEAVELAVSALASEAWLLLTSRIAVAGATAVEVPPLGPDDALALLEERARSAGARRWDAEGARRVVEAVDRLPLGIELAAARLRALSMARIERELARPLRLLRQPGASMEASIAWSWDALDPRERDALTALSVFRGPIRREAVEGMLGPAGHEAVAALENAHLIRAVAGGLAPWHSVREFAEVHGDPDQLSEARMRHATWIAARADDLVDALWGPGFSSALDELGALRADLNAALETATRPEVVARLGRALGELDLEQGHNEALVARGMRLLSRLPDDVAHRAGLWAQLSVAEGRRGRWLAALDCANEALAAATSRSEQVDALQALTVALVRATRPARAAETVERLLEVAGDDPQLRARALGARVLQRIERRDEPFDPAIARQALDAATAAGCERVRGKAMNNYAVALQGAGDLRSARAILEDAIELMARRDGRTRALVHQNLALLSLDTDVEGALRHLEAALEGFRSSGTLDGEVVALSMGGICRAALGEHADALADIDEAIELNVGTRRSLVDMQLQLVRAAALSFAGDFDGARRLVGALDVDKISKGMLLSPDDAVALTEAWCSSEPPAADFVARLAARHGDRRWVHATLLRLRFRDPGGPSSPRPSGGDPATR